MFQVDSLTLCNSTCDPHNNVLFQDSHVFQRSSSVYTALFRRIQYSIVNHCVFPAIFPLLLFILSWRLWVHYNLSLRDRECPLPLPPGNFGLPFLGETLSLIFTGRKFFDYRRQKYGNIFKTHVLGQPTVRVIGEKNVRHILSGENTLVTSAWPQSVQLLQGCGALAQSAGTTHNVRKKAVLRAFSHSALCSYVPTIQEVISNHTKKWCQQKEVNGYPAFKELTFDLSCQVLAGIEMNESDRGQLLKVFETYMSNLFSLPVCIKGSGLYKGLKARKLLLSKIEECIRDKKTSSSRNGFADALMLMMSIDGDGKLTLDELKDVCLELLFAGHETTASATCSLVLQLARNPDVVEKIRTELSSNGLIGGSEPDGLSCLDFNKINKLRYVRNVVKETLRISPPVGAGFRKALKTFEMDGFQIPKGYSVVYSIRDTHEISELFDRPETFDPDRWDNFTTDDRSNFLAFGGGRRGCAGKEFAMLVLKIFTVELIRNCHWSVHNVSPSITYLPVPHPKDGLPMVFSGWSRVRSRRTRNSGSVHF